LKRRKIRRQQQQNNNNTNNNNNNNNNDTNNDVKKMETMNTAKVSQVLLDDNLMELTKGRPFPLKHRAKVFILFIIFIIICAILKCTVHFFFKWFFLTSLY
jgi:hypothetical protein